MKIYYIANNQLPTKKAHGLQIIKTCEALASAGVQCELVIPHRSIDPTIKNEDAIEYYGIKRLLKITRLWSLDLVEWQFLPWIGKLLFWLQQRSFAISVGRYIGNTDAIVYSRDPFSVYALRKSKVKLYWEMHNVPERITLPFYRKILKRLDGLFVISNGIKEHMEKYYKGPITVVPDAVDPDEFNMDVTQEWARKELKLPLDKKIVMYTGHLYQWKGVDNMMAVAPLLPGNTVMVLVGGTEADLADCRARYKNMLNVAFVGQRLHSQIPFYLRAADVLVLPNSAKEKISRLYTSPIKMFEYMASGRPIVASDLPSLREVLNESNAILVAPDDPRALAAGIKKAIDDRDLSDKISKQAFLDARKYTWQKRAELILNSINGGKEDVKTFQGRDSDNPW